MLYQFGSVTKQIIIAAKSQNCNLLMNSTVKVPRKILVPRKNYFKSDLVFLVNNSLFPKAFFEFFYLLHGAKVFSHETLSLILYYG